MARTPDNHTVLPLFCDDLIASCVDMTPSCFGAYMRLLCYAWTRGGLPNSEAACQRISGGIDRDDWASIRSRLVVIDQGSDAERLTHPRLELERLAVAELREKKAAAGRMGGRPKANGKQNESKTKADTPENGKQNESKTKAPNPNPNPNPSPSVPFSETEENSHTHTACGDEFRQAGWAADEWAAFVAAWNATERAAPWQPLMAPSAWVDHAASPGWLERARAAVARLPGCRWFDTPLAVTRFFEYVDRILAGEFDNPKQDRSRPRQRVGGNL